MADLLAPVEPGFFEAIPVSEKVNSVSNVGPDLQERVETQAEDEPAREDGQLSLF
jgi:putative SOS response-associated peptidase YedK